MGVDQALKTLSLLGTLCELWHPKRSKGLLSAANQSFMSSLFEYRAVFRTVAARHVPVGCSSPLVICWADVVLARISALVDHPDCSFAHLPSIQKQREDDMLRAATQLPGFVPAPGDSCNLGLAETCTQYPGSKR